MKSGLDVLSEPRLRFRHGQALEDPHAGLSLFGPYDAEQSVSRGSIAYAAVGTLEGLAAFHSWSARIEEPVVSRAYASPEEDRKPHLLWPPYPGFTACFGVRWPARPSVQRVIDRQVLLAAARHKDKYRRAYETVNAYLDAIRLATDRDEALGVVVCVVPDELWQNCRPKSRVTDGIGMTVSRQERVLRREQADFFSPYAPEEYDLSVDFRRQLKARAMVHNVPLQLLRESTLILREPKADDPRALTPLSDIAWNLSTTLYYKAGGKPWRLEAARDGVCYVGLAFRRSEVDNDARTACCAAQMFLDSGDGVVFRGEFGPWYSVEDDDYHLTSDAAEQLLRGVLDTYHEQGGQQLREIFLHSRSTISAEEFRGYTRACPANVKLAAVRVRRDSDGLRLYRAGKWPVLRGTVWLLNQSTAYLWAAGFKPSLLTYDGWEVPVPLRIDIEHGEADIKQVASDILGLTKLNYNACHIGDAEPVTIRFSDVVGEILIGNPYVKHRRSAFKFYI